MATVLLATDDVGLAVRVQEMLEAAGHRVSWNRGAATTAAAAPGGADLIALAPRAGEQYAPLVEELCRREPPPGILLVGAADVGGEAARLRLPFVGAEAERDELTAAVARALNLRFAARISLNYALGALGLPPGDRGESDGLRVVAAARAVDINLVREALRWHVSDYALANDQIRVLRKHRALKIPEVEFSQTLNGAVTVRTAIGAARDSAEAARALWALAAIGAVTLTAEPQPTASPQARAVFEARRHLRARRPRLRGATYYDVLEVHPKAEAHEIVRAVELLAVRFQPERLASLDLGDITPLVQPNWQEILAAYTELHDPQRRTHYNLAVAARTDVPEHSWAQRRDHAAAETAFARGQRSLVEGKTPKALSDMAFAARHHPGHAVYEASLAWARMRAEVDKGKDRREMAKRERAVAEQFNDGGRPWPQALVALALLCAADGDAEAARWHLREALTCDPTLPAARQMLTRLTQNG